MYSPEDSRPTGCERKSPASSRFAARGPWHPMCFECGQEARHLGPERRQTVRRARLILTVATLLVAGASSALAQGLDLRIGGFFPRASETLFQDVFQLYGVEKSDFYGLYGGMEYNHVVAPNIEVGISVDGYKQTVDSFYRDYTRPDESEIRQQLKLWTLPVGATVRILPTNKHASFVPYVGGGIDAVFYEYEEVGDFIDFYDPSYPIIPDAFHDSGTAFGVHAVAGLRVYINRDFAIVGEGRYQWAKTDMGEDFAPNESGLINTIDLSGPSFTVGLHIRF